VAEKLRTASTDQHPRGSFGFAQDRLFGFAQDRLFDFALPDVVHATIFLGAPLRMTVLREF
jgi:hypothetical protein